MEKDKQSFSSSKKNGFDPFGLRGFNFSIRVPEKSEIFNADEAREYIMGCDYPESADDLLLALEVQRTFGEPRIGRMRILDAMCGPGRLGREFLGLGVQNVWFHDGDKIMTSHAKKEASKVRTNGQKFNVITSPVEKIDVPDNFFDIVISHNATHQMADENRLALAMKEFVRITAPGGHVVIADYQRATSLNFLRALEERLFDTRPEIVPLLIPSFAAAFSKGEFASVVGSIEGIRKFIVQDAEPPVLTPELWKRVEKDFVKGHIMDFSQISLRVIIQKDFI